MKKPDSIIFDMDGTLWDPTDLYLQAWNSGLKKLDIDRTLTAEELKPLMGVNGKSAMELLFPSYSDEVRQQISDTVNQQRWELIKQGGGTLYPGAQEGLKELSKNHKLFIVSNCSKGTIALFMERAGIKSYITDEMAYGVNLMPKHHNMHLLIDKYQLQNPIYVGDTDIDRVESEKAGIPFVYVSYGFAIAKRFDLSFSNFHSLTQHFTNL
ncbi:HAD family hydrolase [Arcticibacter eurypsychrophilus]|uniref:HAD family hydrolase n=1 Tax=Arcticibacter eurypsychrophilus TaxID=1434752 RepID=UPI00084DB914|nr:HAD family hydrolase [Arcticibacter eurypsychrophilus]